MICKISLGTCVKISQRMLHTHVTSICACSDSEHLFVHKEPNRDHSVQYIGKYFRKAVHLVSEPRMRSTDFSILMKSHLTALRMFVSFW